VPLRIFYERLVGRGKPKKAALAAVARKLLVAINAMIRDRRPWEPAVILEPSCCWVIHYDVARDSEVYVHRAGRAGRAGSSVTMVARHEMFLLKRYSADRDRVPSAVRTMRPAGSCTYRSAELRPVLRSRPADLSALSLRCTPPPGLPGAG
jgi:Helicase conserved C-terminal domain